MTVVTTRPVSVTLDSETRSKIERLSKVHRRTAHWLMREAIHEYIDREEKREAFRQDGIKAWNEYQTTGLHVTHPEAEDWLAKLEANQDADLPECHHSIFTGFYRPSPLFLQNLPSNFWIFASPLIPGQALCWLT
ncbi:MAG: CopG family ribbon-helix-helix protein [Thermodesulfobacteriota bacterium]|nr:CopG family ribbon-helix-helix protein [Thermodesulfobacteriota bacterium]